MKLGDFTCGPFAKTRVDTDKFCHNIIFAHAMNECIAQLTALQEEHQEALILDDEDLIEQKRLEMKAIESSIVFTAYVSDAEDSRPI